MFRPIGKAVRFYKTFVNKKPLLVDLEHKAAAEKILTDLTNSEVKLQNRFAMFVIDREDGKVKILEGNYKMMEAFANWSSVNGVAPGAKEGGDWSISVTGSGFGGPNPRRYQTGFMRPSVVTGEELEMLKDLKEKLNLEEIFIAVPLDKLAEKAGGATSSEAAPATEAAPTGVSASAAVESNPLW